MKRLLVRLGWAAAALVAVWALIPRPPLKEGVGLSRAVFDSEGRLLRLTLAPDETYRLWVPLSRFPAALVEATLLHEDQHFRSHPGLNPWALVRAAAHTVFRGGRRMGGSTLTMQLARIRYGIDSRTPVGKLRQILKALQLEASYSKDELLEAYLNLAPYGGNVEGAGTAALVLFGKEVEHLSKVESLALAVVPQSPRARAPGKGEDALRKARLRLFARWRTVHPEDAELLAAVSAPLTVRGSSSLPFAAPHFVDATIDEAPAGASVRTTLKRPLQQFLERQVRDYVARHKAEGIRNASALLLDTRDMGIVASVGSADFFDASIQGQVDGTLAKRSPGSALKPFVYALGYQQGVIHPRSMLKDAPLRFAAFDPENFDGEFKGPLAAEDALVKSRNVPAVYLLSRLEAPGLYGLLRRAGVTELRSESHYGLALVLGGVEVSPVELAELYATLANGGVHHRARRLLDAPMDAGQRLLSPEASHLVIDALVKAPRPNQTFGRDWVRDWVEVAFKTGTSSGHRDAWSAGIFGPYVAVVWVGNFDGTPNPAFVGQSAAAPLLFELVDGVRAQDPAVRTWKRTPPQGLVRTEVCATSGQLPGPHCRHKTQTWFIPGTSPIQRCTLHREVLVDSLTGRQACTEGPNTRREVFEFWPSDLLRLFEQAGMPRRVPPAPGPDCGPGEVWTSGMPPQITSPMRDVDYVLRLNGGDDSVPFSAVTDADAREVFWFVNERLVGKTASAEPLHFKAQPGTWAVRAVDDRGRADVRTFTVRLSQ